MKLTTGTAFKVVTAGDKNSLINVKRQEINARTKALVPPIKKPHAILELLASSDSRKAGVLINSFKARKVSIGPAIMMLLSILTAASCQMTSHTKTNITRRSPLLTDEVELITGDASAYRCRILIEKNLQVSRESLLHIIPRDAYDIAVRDSCSSYIGISYDLHIGR